MAVDARQAQTGTLADAILPGRRKLVQDALLVVAFAALMPLLARIAVPLPFTPVPITGQTFGVLLAGALLGPRRGALAMLVYLAEGLAGLPVFAGGTSAWSPSRTGVPVIVGPSAGYLFSYPLAAWAVGFLAERGWDRRFSRAVAAMLVGEAIIYLVGLPWLGTYVGVARAVPLGLLPFVPGDALKLLLAATALPSAWRLLEAAGSTARRSDWAATMTASGRTLRRRGAWFVCAKGSALCRASVRRSTRTQALTVRRRRRPGPGRATALPTPHRGVR